MSAAEPMSDEELAEDIKAAVARLNELGRKASGRGLNVKFDRATYLEHMRGGEVDVLVVAISRHL